MMAEHRYVRFLVERVGAIPVVVRFDAGDPRLPPDGSGPEGVTGELLAAGLAAAMSVPAEAWGYRTDDVAEVGASGAGPYLFDARQIGGGR